MWWIQSYVEDVEPDEIFKRMQETELIEQMQYAQSSFDEELKRRQK